jgi:hypothetical protein
MKLYATSIPQVLPNWATVISNNAGLIEVEINDEDPGFHSIIEELSTEVELAGGQNGLECLYYKECSNLW